MKETANPAPQGQYKEDKQLSSDEYCRLIGCDCSDDDIARFPTFIASCGAIGIRREEIARELAVPDWVVEAWAHGEDYPHSFIRVHLVQWLRAARAVQ